MMETNFKNGVISLLFFITMIIVVSKQHERKQRWNKIMLQEQKFTKYAERYYNSPQLIACQLCTKP